MARVQIVARKHIVGVQLGIIFDAEPFMRTFNAYSRNMGVAGVQGQDFNQGKITDKLNPSDLKDKIGDFLNPITPKPQPHPDDDGATDNDEPYPDEILDCEYGEWGEWGECYCDDYDDDGVECVRYIQRRWREITQHPTVWQGKVIGKECDNFTETRECPAKDCEIEWGDWSEWSECTQVEGDDGTQERSRSGTITQDAEYGGKSCEEVYQTNDDTFMSGSGEATHKQTRSCEYKEDDGTTVAGSSGTTGGGWTVAGSSFGSKSFSTQKLTKTLGRLAVLGVVVGGSWWAYENRETIGKQMKEIGDGK